MPGYLVKPDINVGFKSVFGATVLFSAHPQGLIWYSFSVLASAACWPILPSLSLAHVLFCFLFLLSFLTYLLMFGGFYLVVSP